jgi:hypothetical protein
MKAQLEIGIIWGFPVSLRHWQHRLTSTAHFFLITYTLYVIHDLRRISLLFLFYLF